VKDLVYAPVDFGFTDELLEELYREAAAEKVRFHSPYRTCEMIPVFTPGGAETREQIRHGRSALEWTPLMTRLPKLRREIETRLFPFMAPLPRIMILVTPPGGEVKVHVDCSLADVDLPQLKLRVVLGGDRTGLWFLGTDGRRHYIDGKNSTYVLNGSQPHGMENRSSRQKFTLCLGSPWNGDVSGRDAEAKSSRFTQALQKGIADHAGSVLWRADVGRPLDPELFQDAIESQLERGLPDPRI
jgi:hypothetical protein